MKKKLISLLFRIYTKLFFWQGPYHPRLYLKIDYSSFPPSIKIQNKGEFIEEKTRELNDLVKGKSYETYLEEVFLTIKNCDYVIFQTPKLEFIQYWIGNGTYWLDFPVAKCNNNKSNLTKIICLLKKLEFKEQKKEGTSLEPKEYCFEKTSELFLLNADFGKDKDLVIKFTTEVLKKIFKVSLNKLEITVG